MSGRRFKVYAVATTIVVALLAPPVPAAAELGIDVSTNHVGDTAGIGNPAGGGPVGPHQCPTGQVMTGLTFYEQNNAANGGLGSGIGIRGECSTISADYSGMTVTLTPAGSTATAMGAGPGATSTAFTGLCGPGNVLTGYDGWSENFYTTLVSAVQLRCAPVTLTGSGVVVGTTSTVGSALGGTGGTVVANNDCPAGNVIGGVNPRVGWNLDYFRLACYSIAQSTIQASLTPTDFAFPTTTFELSISRVSGTTEAIDFGTTYAIVPGTYTGAVSQSGTPIPAALFTTSGTCLTGGAWNNGVDNTCGVTVTGNPDVAASVNSPTVAAGSSGNLVLTVTNKGPAAGTPAASFALPTGVTAGSLPAGCSGTSTITCTAASLAAATSLGASGGAQSFTIPLNVAPGTSSGSVPITVSTSTPGDAVTANDSATATVTLVAAPPTKGGSTDVTPTGNGYWTVTPNGAVVAHGDAGAVGSMAGQPLNAPVVGISATPGGAGYFLAGADGGVFTFGDAEFLGSMADRPLNAPVVSIASTPTGAGYWLSASDGGVFTFGDAVFEGSMAGTALNAPVLGLSPTPTGDGYWLFAGDGGVFTFGDAPFLDNAVGLPLNASIVALTPTPSGNGYWLAGADGGVFTFGDAEFFGSAGNAPPVSPVVGMVGTPSGRGYALVKEDGSVINFGDASL